MVGDVRRRRRCTGVGVERLRQAEVEHLDRAVGADLDVGGLEIAMDDALLVRGLERVGDLPRDRRALRRAAIAPRAIRSASVVALDELHAPAR